MNFCIFSLIDLNRIFVLKEKNVDQYLSCNTLFLIHDQYVLDIDLINFDLEQLIETIVLEFK